MSFDFQPTLKGRLVAMRPLRPEDHDPLYAVASDPLIWEQHPVKNRCEVEDFKEFFQESLASGGALVVIDSQTQQTIGSSRFHAYDATRSEVEIGWTFLARSHWGGRHNGEVKHLMLTHAFAFVRHVVFLVGPENLRSQRAVEKIGGLPFGTRLDAGGRESYVYRIEESTWSLSTNPIESPEVAAAFGHAALPLRGRLLALRQLILETAAATDGVGEIQETLKWGEPAYLTAQTKSGSAVRIGWKGSTAGQYALHFNCQTNLVERFRHWFPRDLRFAGNRTILFSEDEVLPVDSVAVCIRAALRYHLDKRPG